MRSPAEADDWRSLSRLPAPPFALDGLLLVARRSGNAVLRSIRATDFARSAPVADPSSIHRLFQFDEADHAFDEPAHVWANFREPQLTAGLAHFLGRGPSAVSRERIRSFLVAALRCAGRQSLSERIAVCGIATGEAVAEEARVDLIVQVVTTDGDTVGVVIEAKFGHHLTRGQLPAARRHAATRGLADDNTAFLVVLPDTEDVGSAVFSKPGNRRWQAVSWWNLLTRVEASLGAAEDDRSFRAFRHTIWRQTYG